MNDEPDLNYDIDALFKHMTENLDHNPEEEKDWSFTLRSSDFSALEKLADELESEFMIQLQEEVETYDTEGGMSLGPPMLSLIRRGALTADDVKAIAQLTSSALCKLVAIPRHRGFKLSCWGQARLSRLRQSN